MTIRAVFDTNILISALLSVTGPPFRCLALAREGFVESVTCVPILDEFADKLRTKFGFAEDRVRKAVDEVQRISTVVTILRRLSVVKDDPDDDVIVECALQGDATYIVTGDKHLIGLGQYAGVRIIRAAQFVDLVPPPA